MGFGDWLGGGLYDMAPINMKNTKKDQRKTELIRVEAKLKKKLKKIMEENGLSSYSDAIALLIFIYENLPK